MTSTEPPPMAPHLSSEDRAAYEAAETVLLGSAGVAGNSRAASRLPNATVEMVPGAGHAPRLDEPELAVAAVEAHLRA